MCESHLLRTGLAIGQLWIPGVATDGIVRLKLALLRQLHQRRGSHRFERRPCVIERLRSCRRLCSHVCVPERLLPDNLIASHQGDRDGWYAFLLQCSLDELCQHALRAVEIELRCSWPR